MSDENGRGRKFSVGESTTQEDVPAESTQATTSDRDTKENPQAKKPVEAKKGGGPKSKQPTKKGAGQKGKSQPKKKKKWPMVVAIILLVAVIGGGVAYYLYQQDLERQRQERIYNLSVQANDIVQEINNALASKAPCTWVYDRDENLVLTLRLSSGIQTIDTTPTEIATAILTDCNSNPAELIAREFFVSHSMLSSDELLEAYLMRLAQSFTQDDLVRYLAISSEYAGSYVGLTDVANNYFGLTVSQCNTQQLQFLAYCYRNKNVDLEAYLSDHNLTETRLGVIIHRSDYSALRTRVLSELQEIPGIDVTTTSYMVKLSTSTQQQSLLQSSIDNDLRQLIDLNTDGTYTLDCSIVVADRNSGYIRAWVPGRSSSSANAKAFKMNMQTFIPNLTTFAQELSEPNTMNFALRMVSKTNGDTELKSLRELFESQSFGTGNSETKDAIEALQSIFSLSDTFHGVSMIYQVTDTAGTTLYRAEGNTMLYLNNRNLCQYFAGDAIDATAYGFNFELASGLVSMYSTADYVVVVLGGSGALGGTVTSSQMGVIRTAADNIKATVATFYPTPTKNAWDVTGLDSAFMVCYAQNQAYVESAFNDMLGELTTIEVVSRETRREFETQYTAITNFIDSYEEFVGATYADSLRNALQEIRASRTDVLVQYAT